MYARVREAKVERNFTEARYGDLFGGLSTRFNGFEHLFDDLWVQSCAAVEWNRHPQDALAIDAMTAL